MTSTTVDSITLNQGPVPGVRLDGAPSAAADDAPFDLIEPATGRSLARVSGGGPHDATLAVDAAGAALDGWQSTDRAARSAILRRIAADLRRQIDGDLPAILTRESGKRLPESRGEVEFSARYFDWFADVLTTDAGQTWQINPGERHEVTWTALGVVAVLTPWNFPLSIPARKIAPALAAGCTIVFKPSQLTPLSSLAIAEIVERHVPAGVINTVCGDARLITDVWLDDDRVRGLSFTGSTRIGRQLAARAGAGLMAAALELGGRAPFIVLEDADVTAAVEQALVAKFRNNGQSCIAANNFWVARPRWDEFVEKMSDHVRGMSVGDPSDGEVDLGPVRTQGAVTDLHKALGEARDGGAQLVEGGGELPQEGFYVAPTLCLEPDRDLQIWQEEVFGPVAPLRPFDDVSEAIDDANASPYGLAGFVCTRDVEQGLQLARRLESGLLGVNVPAPNTPQIPFGGMKASGYGGYEGGRLGLDPFVEYQSIAVRG